MTFLLAIATFCIVTVGLSLLLVLASKALQDYGACSVDINDGQEVLELGEGGTDLLSALSAGKIFIPSACGGQATCALCRVRVLEGGGPVLPTETPFLSRQEVRTDVRLACQVKVKSDMLVRIPEEYLHVQEYRSTVESVTQLTVDIYEIRLNLVEPSQLDFRPGQFIQILAPNPRGGDSVYRAYSLSNPRSEKDVVELVVRLIPDGICSTYLCKIVQPGDEVVFNGPFGEFMLDESPDSELVCVGGGSGIAPMKSLIQSLLEEWPDRTCSFFFGCRAVKDIFYYDIFDELAKKHPNFEFVYALSEMDEGDEWDGAKGFVHLSVDRMLEEDRKRQAFLCGPVPMVEATTQVLRAKGVKKRRIFFDDFGV